MRYVVNSSKKALSSFVLNGEIKTLPPESAIRVRFTDKLEGTKSFDHLFEAEFDKDNKCPYKIINEEEPVVEEHKEPSLITETKPKEDEAPILEPDDNEEVEFDKPLDSDEEENQNEDLPEENQNEDLPEENQNEDLPEENQNEDLPEENQDLPEENEDLLEEHCENGECSFPGLGGEPEVKEENQQETNKETKEPKKQEKKPRARRGSKSK